MTNNNDVGMTWGLFDKIDTDVSNGFEQEDVIEKYGNAVIDAYEEFGETHGIFEGEWY